MTKHSKNNTASSIFSYAERKKLDYGTKGICSQFCLPYPNDHRFGGNVSVMSSREDSMRVPYICSGAASKRVACQERHLFCKEYAYTDLCDFVNGYNSISGCQIVQWRRRRI